MNTDWKDWYNESKVEVYDHMPNLQIFQIINVFLNFAGYELPTNSPNTIESSILKQVTDAVGISAKNLT